jgi:hypothetical protein
MDILKLISSFKTPSSLIINKKTKKMQQEHQNKKKSVDTKIERVKELCNELAEIVSEHYKSKDSHPIEAIQHNHVIREIAGAEFTIISALNLNFQELISKQ